MSALSHDDDIELIKNRLFIEKSVSEIEKTFSNAFRSSDNRRLSLCVSILVGIIVFVEYLLGASLEEVQEYAGAVVEFGMVLSSASLGVAIAGFAIFASSIRKKILVRLFRANYGVGNVSSLNFVFSVFVNVFAKLFRVIIISSIFVVALSPTSLLLDFIMLAASQYRWIIDYVMILFVFVYIFYLSLAITTMWSFVYNLHQAVLIVSATDILRSIRSKNNDSSINND